jgi:SAM-dependent MidA family methyltransferase
VTPLAERIAALIAASGPLGVADYMATCLFDPAHGYYTTRDPFGIAGDFTTAPEISQMFGELLAVWAYRAWQSAGRPMPVTLAEIGPGRGTLMKDMTRTLSRLDPAFVAGAGIALVETSPRLVEVQKKTLEGAAGRLKWHATVAGLPEQPLFIIGNELFDAVPIRQFVRTASGWRERVVGLDAAGRLAFMAGPGAPDATLLPQGADGMAEGTLVELAPARAALMDAIAARLAAHGGAALFVDYGHASPGFGDTLQAVRRHEYDDVLAHPGEADLTAHVDFAALAAVAHTHGLRTTITPQGEFLLGLGLLERAGRLGAGGDAALRHRLTGEVERLAGPQGMGELFKVLEASSAAFES